MSGIPRGLVTVTVCTQQGSVSRGQLSQGVTCHVSPAGLTLSQWLVATPLGAGPGAGAGVADTAAARGGGGGANWGGGGGVKGVLGAGGAATEVRH